MDGLDNAIREIAELVEENKRLREGLENIKKFKGTDIMYYISIFDKVIAIAERTLAQIGGGDG
jgi:hypothetical protein